MNRYKLIVGISFMHLVTSCIDRKDLSFDVGKDRYFCQPDPA